MIDSIIFDLDGTLWDSCDTVAASWQKTLRESYDPEAVLTAEEVAGIMGMTEEEISAALFSRFGARAGEACRKCLEEECAYCGEHGGRLYPELEKTLALLSREYRLFIVSNCQTGYIKCFLRFTGFGKYFTDFIEQGTTGLSKGGNIRLLASRHGLCAPVYVGDTAGDMSAAATAGVKFIYASYGFGNISEALPSISAPEELPGLVASL